MSHADDTHATRRDFIYYATAGAGVVVTGAAIWPVQWQGKPVFIRRRTQEEIEAARAVDVSDLVDPIARNNNIQGQVPATDANRVLDDTGQWLVMVGVCTHLGCIPLGDGAGDFGGWFCPCHGSHYDTAGRIRKGPAPENLLVPVAEFLDDATIRLG